MPERDTNEDMFEQEGGLRQFVISALSIPAETEGHAAQELFDNHPEAEGIVVTERSMPVGVIMRTMFFQTMGTRYGHSLYMKRPIRILMDAEFMKADVTDGVLKVGMLAMNRPQSKLYDYVVVYENRSFFGVISIRRFLVELSRRNEAQINVLKTQQQLLLSAHEQELSLRRNLEYQSASVRNLLDHADQGFLWFSSDLVVGQEYSYKCKRIFHKAIGGSVFSNLVAPYFAPEKAAVFQMAFESYFKNNSPVTDHVYLMLLPGECVINGRNIHMEYRRIESGGQKAVMVILNDVTEKIALEKAMDEDRDRQRLLIKAFTCQPQIRRMMEEFSELLQGGYRNLFFNGVDCFENLNALFRAVHTFKGDFAQYGFVRASEKLHAFEDELFALLKKEGASVQDVERVMAGASANEILKDDIAVINEALGSAYLEQSETLSIPKSKLIALEERIRDTNAPIAPQEALRILGGLRRRNIKMLLEQYRDYLQYLADRLMKSMPVYIVEGDDVEVDEEQYADFFKSFVHICRNIMDHGVEPDEERLENGKTQTGLVRCSVEEIGGGRFTLDVSDDGRGIDIEKVREKALTGNLCTLEELNAMTKNEIVRLILLDGLSTNDNANALSGRGMGMPAFLRACEALGGTLAVTTEKGSGTCLHLTLPY